MNGNKMKRTKCLRKHQPTILTNDPSMTGWGYAVIDYDGNILFTGCIKTVPKHKKLRIRKGDDTIHRISEINTILKGVIRIYNVKYILSELPHGSRNASAAVMIGLVAAIAQTFADALDLGIEWYSEGDVKKFMLGKQAATKQEMIDAVEIKTDWKHTGTKYKDEAVADALGVYLTAMNESPALKMMKTM